MKDKYNISITTLSVGELIDIVKEAVTSGTQKEIIYKEEKKYAYGLRGLAYILGCSRTHAVKVKNSGILDEAIVQNGRKIIIDVDLAIKLFKKNYE